MFSFMIDTRCSLGKIDYMERAVSSAVHASAVHAGFCYIQYCTVLYCTVLGHFGDNFAASFPRPTEGPRLGEQIIHANTLSETYCGVHLSDPDGHHDSGVCGNGRANSLPLAKALNSVIRADPANANWCLNFLMFVRNVSLMKDINFMRAARSDQRMYHTVARPSD